jgi:hypothetical protein
VQAVANDLERDRGPCRLRGAPRWYHHYGTLRCCHRGSWEKDGVPGRPAEMRGKMGSGGATGEDEPTRVRDEGYDE